MIKKTKKLVTSLARRASMSGSLSKSPGSPASHNDGHGRGGPGLGDPDRDTPAEAGLEAEAEGEEAEAEAELPDDVDELKRLLRQSQRDNEHLRASNDELRYNLQQFRLDAYKRQLQLSTVANVPVPVPVAVEGGSGDLAGTSFSELAQLSLDESQALSVDGSVSSPSPAKFQSPTVRSSKLRDSVQLWEAVNDLQITVLSYSEDIARLNRDKEAIIAVLNGSETDPEERLEDFTLWASLYRQDSYRCSQDQDTLSAIVPQLLELLKAVNRDLVTDTESSLPVLDPDSEMLSISITTPTKDAAQEPVNVESAVVSDSLSPVSHSEQPTTDTGTADSSDLTGVTESDATAPSTASATASSESIASVSVIASQDIPSSTPGPNSNQSRLVTVMVRLDDDLTAEATCNFTSEQPDELSFSTGDLISVSHVTKQMSMQEVGDGGWWKGSLNGRSGLFPMELVTKLETRRSNEIY